LSWEFTLPAPFSKMKATLTALGSLQLAIAQKRNGQSLFFSVVGSRVSSEAQATRSCSMADLVSDARTRAQSLASAAGVSVGPILEVTPTRETTNGISYQVSLAANVGIGSVTGQLIQPYYQLTGPTETCGIVVKFRLLS
jgi:hypothetical protein